MRARGFPCADLVQDQNHERQRERLQFLTYEIDRLIHHPGLFPSPATQARFYAIIGLDAEIQFSQAYKELLLKAQMRRLAQTSRSRFTRVTFQPGSKNWENFLLDGGIGTSCQALQSIPKSVIQIIPAVGMRIIGDYEREENEIIRFVEEVGLMDGTSPSYVHTADCSSLKSASMSCQRRPHY